MKETPTKLERVAYHLLENGHEGASALSGFADMKDLNFRNSISELRRDHGIIILDERFEHHHTGGGTVSMKRYRIATEEDVRKLVALVNLKRAKRGAVPIPPEQVARCLKPYENAPRFPPRASS